MTTEQQAAYVFAQSICALVEAMGMLSDNLYRIKRGMVPAFTGDEFNAVIDRYGISHIAVIGLFNQ